MNGSSAMVISYFITFYVFLCILLALLIYAIMYRYYRICFGHFNLSTRPTISHEPQQGLEASVIDDNFPKFAYLNKSVNTDINIDIDINISTKVRMTGECVVCLGVFEENEMLRLLPKCGHVFHVDCIDTWLRSHATCPFCRANLVVVSDVPPREVPTRAESSFDGNHRRLGMVEITPIAPWF
ncbi:E3 ubiquitin-protein ligase ATL6-like [Chenopodium quinoa]|uniref:E3 ubiquitin-protein ligase ATL6-like n=1 Tax=Chenopodium quinoa TaxID=63459 RepID=UPI000B785496|nr:E3 ubiquitin-protein ligase ATL6-like [Chenopodium quinoa]